MSKTRRGMRRLGLIIGIILSIYTLKAQSETAGYFLINKQPIDPDRYAGINGTPYLFKHWLKARIISRQVDVV